MIHCWELMRRASWIICGATHPTLLILIFRGVLTFNGSFSLTPKWNFSMNGYYDFHTKNLQTFTMSINREMHCWQLAINVTPVGPYRMFSFTISPKSGMLQDLKVNRTRYFTSD